MDEIDKLFKGAPFSGEIVRPERAIAWWIAIEGENAEKKREAARGHEKRMSCQIEDHIAFGALRQCGKAAPVFNWQLAISDLIVPLALQLQGRLVMESFECGRRNLWNSAIRPRLSQRSQGGEPRSR